MSTFTNIIDSLAYNWNYAVRKFRTPRRTPPYIAAELSSLPSLGEMGLRQDIFRDWDEERKKQVAARIVWVYANVQRIGNEVSAAKFNVTRKDDRATDILHPLEDLMQKPNEFFSGTTLLQYLIWGLSFDEYGAFWYLAPDSQTGGIREIWPIPINAMKPIPHKEQFIKEYEYSPRRGGKPITIPARFIARFAYAHPFNIYKSLPPLEAAALARDSYLAQATTQRDIYKEGKGVPLAVLALDPNISDPDFAVARDTIRKDWMEQNSIAIVRGGTLDVKTLGLTAQQLQLVESLQFAVEEFDAAFMAGIVWHGDNISGDERQEINKQIKETVIHPLHMLIGGGINSQILERFYGKQWVGEFDDVRAQDRAIRVQEFTVSGRAMTFDEGRKFWGLEPFNDSDLPVPMPGFGSVPLQLATNPAFVSALYPELGPIKDPGAGAQQVGNMPEFQDPEMTTNQLVGQEQEPQNIDIKAGVLLGMKQDLGNYKKILKRAWRKNESPSKLAELEFDTVVIPAVVMAEIKAALYDVGSQEDIDGIFAKWL